jgi:TrmH family RNA methyltransferase
MKGRQSVDMRAIRITPPDNLKNIWVILNEPQVPGNIGSTARAMKGMGLTQLILVNPAPGWRKSEQPWTFACWSHDILHNAREVGSLEDILGEIHFLVGTTNRRRDPRLPEILPAREGAERIAEISRNHVVGVMFGREDFGLSTDDISRCHLCLSVPMAVRNPSLNLSHAVAIIAYEILMASLGDIPSAELDLPPANDLEALTDRVIRLLKRTEFKPANDNWNTLLYSIRRVLTRAQFERRDVATLHLIFAHIEGFISRRLGSS